MSYPDGKKEISGNESDKNSEFAENFVSATREMYLTENPNPERVGCFANETIRQIANSAKLPDDSVMNHLLDCSECFRDYRQALSSAKKNVAIEAENGWRNIFKWSPSKLGSVGAVFVLAAGLTFFAFLVFREKPSTELAKNIEISNEQTAFNNSDIPKNENKTESNQTVKNGNEGQLNSPEKQSNQILQTQPKKAKTTRRGENKSDSINLTLSDDNVLRKAAKPDEKSVENEKTVLPARKVNLNIKLPDNFPDGRYQFRIVDAFGSVLLEKNIAVKNRRLALTNLNLQNLGNKANKICLQKSNEMPDCFDIKIAR